jgi:amino acid transporter
VAFAGVGDSGTGLANEENASDVFHALGSSVFGSSAFGTLLEFLLVHSVLTSASASTRTTILPTARTALSMGAYRAVPPRFARAHPRYLTPVDATIGMGIVSIVFYVGLTLVSENVLADSIGALGLMITFYYGMTGFACVWYYRKAVLRGGRDLLMKGVLPLLGGVLLFGAFVEASIQYADPEYGNTKVFGIGGVFVIGIGALVFGVVLMLVSRAFSADYFAGRTLPRRGHHDLVLVGATHEGDTIRLPDSGLPEIVIAPDLSNLPPGTQAVELDDLSDSKDR